MGSIVSGIGALIGSGAAARKADAGASILSQRYGDVQGYLSPYVTAGQNVLDPLQALAMAGPTGGLPNYLGQAAANVPLQMTQSQLEQTPGYQFTLGEGLKATQSAAAARGLGVSRAALTGATGYATGLANATYKDQFNIAQQRFADYLNLQSGGIAQTNAQAARLQNVAGMGVTAGTGLGQIGANLAAGQSQALTASGAAQLTGDTQFAQGIGTAINQAGYAAFPQTFAASAPQPNILIQPSKPA